MLAMNLYIACALVELNMDRERIAGLKQRLAELEQERQAILQLLQIWDEGGEWSRQGTVPVSSQSKSYSVSGRIVDATIELIHRVGRPVANSEIFEYVKEKQLPFGNTNNPNRMLAAILANETKKRNAKLKKAARGYFEIKQ